MEQGADVSMLEKADKALAGGNTEYTAGAMRFPYDGGDDLIPLLRNAVAPRLPNTDFGSYTQTKMTEDPLGFNEGRPLSPEQTILITKGLETMLWLSGHHVTLEPICSRQNFGKDGK
ncbi:hypothetical protein LGQ03_09470 [Loktanella sp. TSTF-M6]|uniref:Uncharacterized protein n=1 Tax=Loktanella gaetbuli TaxID=2881335 RepID=A0ABS8BUR9_9RHOB|nr:hypothetical protein [Loktanella gaetbuli]MCB5199468.1 hypothetical protein [Loktanella gaetbuli]